MTRFYLGLISGTSADAIDAALLDFAGEKPQVRAARSTPYPAALRERVLGLSQQDAAVDLDAFGALDTAIGEAFATAAH